jgi:hypothetical protein
LRAKELQNMKPMPPPFWELISERVYKTDLGDDKPEVVVTLMSDAAFKKFRKTKSGAKNYIDGLKILKQKLNAVEFTDTIAHGNGRTITEWLVVIIHTTKSTAYIIAWQQTPPAPPEPGPKLSQSDLRTPPSKRAGAAPKTQK